MVTCPPEFLLINEASGLDELNPLSPPFNGWSTTTNTQGVVIRSLGNRRLTGLLITYQFWVNSQRWYLQFWIHVTTEKNNFLNNGSWIWPWMKMMFNKSDYHISERVRHKSRCAIYCLFVVMYVPPPPPPPTAKTTIFLDWSGELLYAHVSV